LSCSLNLTLGLRNVNHW